MAAYEPLPLPGDDAPDDEDLALQRALAGMQQLVETHVRATGRNTDDLSAEEQQQFVNKLAPYLAFELSSSEDM